MLDRTTEFGGRAERRLRDDRIGWLITVRPDGTPIPVPVWFLWDGATILVYSQPRTGKIRNLAHSPRASFCLRTDEHGNDVVVVTGNAHVDGNAPRADMLPAYLEKYGERLPALGVTASELAEEYSVAVRLVPDRISGF